MADRRCLRAVEGVCGCAGHTEQRPRKIFVRAAFFLLCGVRFALAKRLFLCYDIYIHSYKTKRETKNSRKRRTKRAFMAKIVDGVSHTFSEYLFLPGYTSEDCVPSAVSLETPLVRFRKGQEECPLRLQVPLTSAIMQSVSGDRLAIALAKEGGLSFIYGSQSIEDEAAMVARVKNDKAGFVVSDSNLTPDNTLADVLELVKRTGHNTVAVTHDGTANGKLLGIVTGRDYRVSRMSTDLKVGSFMTGIERLVTAPPPCLSNRQMTSSGSISSIPCRWWTKRGDWPIWSSARITASINPTPANCWTAANATWWARASTPATTKSGCPPC